MKNFFLTLVLFITLSQLKSQSIDSMMKLYAQDYPQQKLHVHLDKTVYRPGETIWFKSYIFEGFSPSDLSNNFYAELIGANGKVIERKVYPIVEQSAAGFFDIPQNTPSTVLNIRAYTTWMLNFDTAFLFQKPITVVKRGTTETKVNALVDAASTSISFFPEGGNLVAGIECNIAFKANDKIGMPVQAKGKITDSKGTSVTTFQSVHNGFGKVSFTPAAGESYKAIWTDDNGREQTTTLPAVQAEGLVLSAQQAKGKLIYYLTRTDNVPAEMRSLHIIGHFAQAPVYKMDISLESTFMTSGIIPLKDLASGILQLTVFSNDWKPLAERIVMVNNNRHLFGATIDAKDVNPGKRLKNVIEVDVADTFSTNMSVAITDIAISQNQNDDNIISRLLLTGDIKGYVHEPGYYFSNTSDSVAKHLDLVMLTHGWRKYNWEQVAQKKFPTIRYPLDSVLTLQAKIYGLGTTKLQSDEQLIAFVTTKDSTSKMLNLPKTGPDRFALPVVFYDTVKVFYKFQKNRTLENTATVSIENNFYKGPIYVTPKVFPYLLAQEGSTIDKTKQLDEEIWKQKSVSASTHELGMVTVKTKLKTKSRLEELEDNYAQGLFKGISGQSFDLTDPSNNNAFNIFTFLQGRVAGITINNPTGANPSITWRNIPTSLFLDETPVDASVLASLNVNNIAYVKVYRPPFLGASGGGPGGGIVVYTKKGGDNTQTQSKGLSKATVAGYSYTKEFYVPDYSNPASTADVVSDFRSTLLWQPYVFTDAKNKKVKLEFYNNDISTSFRVILEGVNEAGQMIHIEKVISK